MTTKYRAGIIGRTNRGDYGHGLDTVYIDAPNVDCVAVADDDPEGLDAAGERLGVDQRYANYRLMLERERLDIVSVAPRWVDCHAEMVVACAEAGVKGIFCEKPMAKTLSEADAMLVACERFDVKIAVAHRRACAYEQYGKQLVEAGEIGAVQTIKSHGKCDRRHGAMDLAVLGTHMMDSMRFFAGADVSWAYGHVSKDGREVTSNDAYEEKEGIGRVAGERISAYYAFGNGVTGSFESYPGDNPGGRWFGFEVHGTEGIIALRGSPGTEMYLYPHAFWTPGEENEWQRIHIKDWDENPDGSPRTGGDQTHLSNLMIMNELIQAIENGTEVTKCSSGADARAALEMIMAVHESQRVKGRVQFPLTNRNNPYDPLL